MEHKGIAQAQLVHDVISFNSGFTAINHTADSDELDVLDYDWYATESPQAEGQAIAHCMGKTWVGVKAA